MSVLSLAPLTHCRVAFCSMGAWPRRTLGLSLLRIGLGAALVHFYVSSYGDRRLIWGPDGLGLESGLGSHIWRGPAAFEFLFHASLVAALGFAVFGGRVLTGLNWMLLYSIHGRNPLVLDGGDNLLRVLLPLMLLTETNLHFSPQAHRRRERWARRIAEGRSFPLRAFVHNCGVVLIIFQVLTVYGVAVLWKLGGEPWRNGTAMYYITNADEFAYRTLPRFIVNNPYLITAVTYSVMVGQVTIVLLGILKRRGIALLVVALVLHGGIALSMGLMTFSLVMIAAGGILLRDADWLTLGGSISGRRPPQRATPDGGQTEGNVIPAPDSEPSDQVRRGVI